MSASFLAERLQYPLVWVIAAVFALSSVSALLVEPRSAAGDATRADVSESPLPTDPALGGVDVVETFPSDGATDPPTGPTDDPTAPDAAISIGISAVPEPGVYRYQVQTTDADGESTVQEEHREIQLLSGDRTAGIVEITARIDGDSQVSVMDWSPSGAFVRSTRIESPTGAGQDCTWDPPFVELGALGEGAVWNLDSSCRAPVSGIDTAFRISGEGRVAGQAVVTFAGQELRVWQILRDRTTTIEAQIEGTMQEQRAREEGVLFFDPVRGVVIRSDVTLTLEGARSGVSRRISVLQPS